MLSPKAPPGLQPPMATADPSERGMNQHGSEEEEEEEEASEDEILPALFQPSTASQHHGIAASRRHGVTASRQRSICAATGPRGPRCQQTDKDTHPPPPPGPSWPPVPCGPMGEAILGEGCRGSQDGWAGTHECHDGAEWRPGLGSGLRSGIWDPGVTLRVPPTDPGTDTTPIIQCLLYYLLQSTDVLDSDS
ncbi:unnamed protein product [Gadus morhua 'NCC']